MTEKDSMPFSKDKGQPLKFRGLGPVVTEHSGAAFNGMTGAPPTLNLAGFGVVHYRMNDDKDDCSNWTNLMRLINI